MKTTISICILSNDLQKANELEDEIDLALKKAKAGHSTGAGYDLIGGIRDIDFEGGNTKKMLSIMEPIMLRSSFKNFAVTVYDKAGEGSIILRRGKKFEP